MPRWNYKCVRDRFLIHVDIKSDNECWEWKSSKSYKGYGQFAFNFHGRRIHSVAHRFSWMLFNGKIPNGMLICHHCDNPSCVNPKHLFLGTNQDNMEDRNMKGRQAHPKGSKNGYSKLNEKQIYEIRKLISSTKLSYPEIARLFNVSRSTIGAIVSGQNWAWL